MHSCAARASACARTPLESAIMRAVAAVAQWIEYWPPKPRVVGSIPASRTNEFNDLENRAAHRKVAALFLPHFLPHQSIKLLSGVRTLPVYMNVPQAAFFSGVRSTLCSLGQHHAGEQAQKRQRFNPFLRGLRPHEQPTMSYRQRHTQAGAAADLGTVQLTTPVTGIQREARSTSCLTRQQGLQGPVCKGPSVT